MGRILSSSILKYSLLFPCCVVMIALATRLAGQNTSTPPSTQQERDEQDALKVLNDSPWARTVTPSTQDVPCTYANPVFPDLYPKDQGILLDGRSSPVTPLQEVKPDRSEYLIRLQSVKPVQAAIGRLLGMGEKWSAYREKEWPVSRNEGSTDVPNGRYNVADLITIAVILKHADPAAPNFFDYGTQGEGRAFPSKDFRVWPCASLRTANGQVIALVVPIFKPTHAFQLSFQRLVQGKPLIQQPGEKVEFRMVANQRVFEATFFVDGSDVLDGSESVLYLPSAFTDLMPN